MRDLTYFKRGELYNEDKYFKTANAFGQLPAWQNVDIRPEVRGKDSLDLYFL